VALAVWTAGIVVVASHREGPTRPARRAIVAVVDAAMLGPDASPTRGGLCSGAFVARGWVLTAWHCLQMREPAVVVDPPDLGARRRVMPVVRVAAHPDADLALLEVAGSAPEVASVDPVGGPGIVPIPAASSGGLPPIGGVVEFAGRGLSSEGTVGTLHAAAGRIAAVDASSVTVSGFGKDGPCVGDSGGPLLVRSPDGESRIAGVLSFGSPTCDGPDTYTRVDRLGAWLRAAVSPDGSGDAACGALASSGRCLYGRAMWCSARTPPRHAAAAAACWMPSLESTSVPLDLAPLSPSTSSLPAWATPPPLLGREGLDPTTATRVGQGPYASAK